MAGIRTASTWLKIALVAIVLALILFVVGFATKAWVVSDAVGPALRWTDWKYWSIGLWQDYVCPKVHKSRYQDCYETGAKGLFGTAAWFHASQAMECLGLIFLIITFVLLLLYTCSNSFKRRSYLVGVIVCTFLAVGFIVIGVVILITKYGDVAFDIGWSMGLAIAAAVCALISGIMSLLELCSR